MGIAPPWIPNSTHAPRDLRHRISHVSHVRSFSLRLATLPTLATFGHRACALTRTTRYHALGSHQCCLGRSRSPTSCPRSPARRPGVFGFQPFYPRAPLAHRASASCSGVPAPCRAIGWGQAARYSQPVSRRPPHSRASCRGYSSLRPGVITAEGCPGRAAHALMLRQGVAMFTRRGLSGLASCHPSLGRGCLTGTPSHRRGMVRESIQLSPMYGDTGSLTREAR